MHIKAVLAILFVIGSVVLYQASNWWERAFATHTYSQVSPDGCIRIETYRPFWVLPSVLHRMPHPDPTSQVKLGMTWNHPIFKRAHEVRTGDTMGESIVFDPTMGDNSMDWGDPKSLGRRIVKTNGFPLVDSNRCSDGVTLAKLEAYYQREREAGWALEDARAKQRIDSNRESE